MKKNCINFKSFVLMSMMVTFAFLQSCDLDNEVEFIGNASIQGRLQYLDVMSGEEKDVPKGASITLYFNGNAVPSSTVQTAKSGYWDFAPPAIGFYEIEVRMQDTLMQFASALVRKEDIDTTRSTEYSALTYEASVIVEVKRNEQKFKDLLLLPQLTGLRITAKDEFGNPLKGVSMCLYNNETFYQKNFPHCGGSIKYIATDDTGRALFLGLTPNTTYFVNARGRVGSVSFNNHYARQAQTFQSGNKEVILDREVILK